MKKIIWLFAVIILLAACQKEKYFPATLPQTHVNIVRFDSALLHIDQHNLKEGVTKLYEDYPGFMPYYTQDILGIWDVDTLATLLPHFLNDTLYGFKEINAKAEKEFRNIDAIQEELDGAFARLTYLYPEIDIPTIYFFVSGFRASLTYFDEADYTLQWDNSQLALAVGIDMYLGSDFPYYNDVVHNYQKFGMRKECIAADIVSTYLFLHFPSTSTKSRLLENMLYRGKMMYLLSLLFPEQSEAEIMGYTKEQMEWCERNEAAVWQMMVDKKDLFKTESLVLSSYLNDGPFTSEISQESPARLGTWIGWQICESYMKHNDVSLQHLLAEGDAQLLLQQSHYKP